MLTTKRPVTLLVGYALMAADKPVVSSNGTDKAATTTIAKRNEMLDEACPGVAS